MPIYCHTISSSLITIQCMIIHFKQFDITFSGGDKKFPKSKL